MLRETDTYEEGNLLVSICLTSVRQICLYHRGPQHRVLSLPLYVVYAVALSEFSVAFFRFCFSPYTASKIMLFRRWAEVRKIEREVRNENGQPGATS